MHERFIQHFKTSNPHFSGRKGVHPGNDSNAVFIGIGFDANFENLVRSFNYRLKYNFYRNFSTFIQSIYYG